MVEQADAEIAAQAASNGTKQNGALEKETTEKIPVTPESEKARQQSGKAIPRRSPDFLDDFIAQEDELS